MDVTFRNGPRKYIGLCVSFGAQGCLGFHFRAYRRAVVCKPCRDTTSRREWGVSLTLAKGIDGPAASSNGPINTSSERDTQQRLDSLSAELKKARREIRHLKGRLAGNQQVGPVRGDVPTAPTGIQLPILVRAAAVGWNHALVATGTWPQQQPVQRWMGTQFVVPHDNGASPTAAAAVELLSPGNPLGMSQQVANVVAEVRASETVPVADKVGDMSNAGPLKVPGCERYSESPFDDDWVSAIL
jgi:hypothetical protein